VATKSKFERLMDMADSRRVLIDTNIVLSHPEIFEHNENDIFIIHSVIAEELDNQIHNKHGNNELAYKARKARNAIKAAKNVEYTARNGMFAMPNNWDICKNDNTILQVAKDLLCCGDIHCLYTNDLAMQIKADMIEVKWEEYNGKFDSEDRIYKGYRDFSGDTEFVNKIFDEIEKEDNIYGFVVNEYLIVHNTDTKKSSEYRYDGNKFVSLKLPNSNVIKGLNPEQRCALDLLNNKDIGINAILGTYGSGKTKLSVAMALYHVRERQNQSKILVVRSPEAQGKEIGYLKGDFDSKTSHFFKPIEQNLKGGEFEMQSLIQTGTLEKTIPQYMKGTTYDDTYIVVDEAEDLCKDQIKMVGTRLGKNSVITFCGDYKQAIRLANTDNPLVKMCLELKGDPNFGCIVLPEDVRSELSRIFANLFE
jgi:PhoH-like ATPase